MKRLYLLNNIMVKLLKEILLYVLAFAIGAAGMLFLCLSNKGL